MGDITPATFASGSWRCDITLTKMCLTKRTVKMEVNLPSRGFLPKTRRVLFSSTVSFILEELESAPVRQEVHGFVALMPSVKNKSFWGWKSGSREHDYLTLTRHVCFQTAGFSFTLWHVYFSVRREVEGHLEAPSLLLTLNRLTHSTTKTFFFPALKMKRRLKREIREAAVIPADVPECFLQPPPSGSLWSINL